ncbi:protein SDA1 homolog [Neocloeon triangulifer]|uniref:protein SDA1 homolog n=1 Tax=Neocloeon triangulifer TaxID=2078957 RepID=UPI00286FAC2D|nr:protein SDA1 homolog [Neocloeon triangulifer]
MVRRHNNQLPDNIPQLQNLIKRDPVSYKDEFMQQYRHYQATLEVFKLHPDQNDKNLDEIVMFLAQVAQCYPDVLEAYPQELVDILQSHHTVLDPNMRMSFCRALVLLRGKGLLSPTDLLSLFFSLLRCQDKNLRTFLQTHIINDVSGINAKHKDAKLNRTLQNFMFNMLKDSNSRAVKMSLDIMIQLYKKNIWNDAKTVNVIATACYSKFAKVKVAALKFFIGKDPEEKESDDSDSDDDEKLTTKEVVMSNRFNKKSRKREKQLLKVKSLIKKQQKKKSKAPNFNFSALHLIHDPQGFAEQIFKTLERANERFEVKLMTLDVISRLIGLHQLFIFNFYPYLQRFLQPHQREVTRLLQFVAQAAHELVPPDIIQPILKTLVNNFVTERNSSDVMAIGLNAVRAICSRCPLAMDEDLLRDLIEYRNYKDRSVMMASRSLMALYRLNNPDMLRKKDRGRPTEATIELKPRKYGEMDTKEHIPGAEVLLDEKKKKKGIEVDEDGSDSDDGGWVDVSGDEAEDSDEGSGAEECQDEEGEDDEDSEGDDEECEDESDEDEDMEDEDEDESGGGKSKKKKEKEVKTKDEDIEEKSKKAAEVCSMRILTDEDFKAIDAAQIRKQITVASKSRKRKIADEDVPKGELVTLGDIENIHKKRKHDKAARLETVRKGQEGREKWGYQDRRQNPHSSKTNTEKKKNKAFNMIKHKIRGKVKRSFKDKQISLRNHLLKMKRLK